jgi:ribosomal-protein-alanine N-acetyltransferase
MFRRPSNSDLPALLRIENACFTGDYAPHRFRRADFAAFFSNPRAMFRLAVRDGEPVGYVVGVLRREHGRLTARVDSIAVLPGRRRQGFGSKLLTWFLDEARAHRSEQATLEVAVSNALGLAWFTQAGFEERRRLPNYYGSKIDGIEMRIRLANDG